MESVSKTDTFVPSENLIKSKGIIIIDDNAADIVYKTERHDNTKEKTIGMVFNDNYSSVIEFNDPPGLRLLTDESEKDRITKYWEGYKQQVKDFTELNNKNNIVRSTMNETFDKYENYYNELGIINGSCKLKWGIKNKDGEEGKIASGMPTGDRSKHQTKKWNVLDNAAYIIPELSGILPIDVDHVELCPTLDRLCKTHCKCIVQTLKGNHYWFKLSDKLKFSLKSKTLGFDIPKLLFSPPSFYHTPIIGKDGCLDLSQSIAEYKFVNSNGETIDNLQDLSIVDIPDEIVNEIERLDKELKNSKKNTKDNNTNTNTNTATQKTFEYPATCNTSENSKEKVRDALKIIQHKNKDYGDWLNVGMALHNTNPDLLNIWQEWSKADYPNYDEVECEKKWNGFKTDKEKKLGFGSIILWCQESNQELYNEWKKKYGHDSELKKIKDLVADFSNNKVARYVHGLKREDFLYNLKDNKWYVLGVNNLWEERKQGILTLVNDMVEPELKRLRFSYDAKNKIADMRLAQNNITKEDKARLEKLKTKYNQQASCVTKVIHKLGGASFSEAVVKYLKELYGKDITFDKSPSVLSFKNGVYEMDTGLFRDRKPEDYISITLPIDYISEINQAKIDMIRERIFRNNIDLIKWIAMCITGVKKHKKNILINEGMGRTGKSTLAEIFQKCLPYKIKKLDKDLFVKNYNYIQKQTIHLLPPTTLLWLDEPGIENWDENLVKVFCEEEMNVNVMYKNSDVITNMCKLYVSTNSSPRFRPDSGFLRRGLFMESTIQFKPDDENFEDVKLWFDKEDYQLAFIQLLLPYAREALNEVAEKFTFPELSKKFEERASEQDTFKTVYEEFFEETEDDKDRVSRQQMIDKFKEVYGENYKISERSVLENMRRIGKGDLWKKNYRLANAGRNSPQGVFIKLRPTNNTRNILMDI